MVQGYRSISWYYFSKVIKKIFGYFQEVKLFSVKEGFIAFDIVLFLVIYSYFSLFPAHTPTQTCGRVSRKLTWNPWRNRFILFMNILSIKLSRGDMKWFSDDRIYRWKILSECAKHANKRWLGLVQTWSVILCGSTSVSNSPGTNGENTQAN